MPGLLAVTVLFLLVSGFIPEGVLHAAITVVLTFPGLYSRVYIPGFLVQDYSLWRDYVLF